MNVILGGVTSDTSSGGSDAISLERALAFLRATHQAPPRVAVQQPTLFGVSVSDGGVISGQAESEGVLLLFLGTLHLPLEGWPSASAVDDPARSAAYLLERYQERGTAFLDHVTGQYCVAVFDPARRRVVLACDPLQQRTLYYFLREGRLVFSSNLRALAVTLGSWLEADRSLEDFFLTYGFYPWGRTCFKDVRSLSRGTLLDWSDGKVTTREIAFSDPWQGAFDASQLAVAGQEQAVQALYEGFLRALREQLSDDERVGVLLGGFDSALVAAALHRLGKKVVTFSFHYGEAQYNQPHVDTLQRLLGHEHHWVELTTHSLEQGLRDFASYFNQPTNWPNYVIQTADICQYARQQGIRVCYSGDGCDAVFMGYPGTFQRARVFQRLPTLPPAVGDAFARLAARPGLERRLGHPYHVALSLVRALGRRMPARGYLSFRVMDEVSLSQLRRGAAVPQEKAPEQVMRELAEPHAGLPPLRLAYLGKSAVSPNRNKMVGSSDRSGVAILSPYLHPGMKQLSLSLPEALCRPDAKTPSRVSGKYILMQMAERKGLLPSEIIYQPKMAAVDGPIDAWYAGPLRPVLIELMAGLPFDYSRDYAQALLDEKLAEQMYKKYVMTDKVISHAASLLTTYAAFTRLVKERPSPP